MKTKNCNIRFERCEIYCGRGSGPNWNPFNCGPGDKGIFGNPVSVGKRCPICKEIHREAGSTLSCYETYLKQRLSNDPAFKSEFYNLKGKLLGCFCKPGSCHTDIMIKLLDNE